MLHMSMYTIQVYSWENLSSLPALLLFFIITQAAKHWQWFQNWETSYTKTLETRKLYKSFFRYEMVMKIGFSKIEEQENSKGEVTMWIAFEKMFRLRGTVYMWKELIIYTLIMCL